MQDVLGKTPVNPNVQTTIGPDAIQVKNSDMPDGSIIPHFV